MLELELGVRVSWQVAGPKESKGSVFKDKINPFSVVYVWNWYHPQATRSVTVKILL